MGLTTNPHPKEERWLKRISRVTREGSVTTVEITFGEITIVAQGQYKMGWSATVTANGSLLGIHDQLATLKIVQDWGLDTVEKKTGWTIRNAAMREYSYVGKGNW